MQSLGFKDIASAVKHIEEKPRGFFEWVPELHPFSTLNTACYDHEEPIIEALLKNGCDPNTADSTGYGALGTLLNHCQRAPIEQVAREIKLVQAYGGKAGNHMLLYVAARDGCIDLATLYLAYIPEPYVLNLRLGVSARSKCAAGVEAAPVMLALATAHMRDPAANSFLMRVKCGEPLERTAMLYVLILAWDRGYFRRGRRGGPFSRTVMRFLKMVMRFPPELQMLVAQRAMNGIVRVADERLAWRVIMTPL